MKNMRVFKRQVGGYMSALEKSRPELYKTIKAYRDRLDKPGEQKTFDKRANIQFATSLNMPKQMREAYYASIEKQFANICTVKPLKTATLWGMPNWPSYRGGRLMEHMCIPYLQN